MFKVYTATGLFIGTCETEEQAEYEAMCYNGYYTEAKRK